MQELVSSSGIRGFAMDEVSPRLCANLGIALSGRTKGIYAVGHDVRLTSALLASSIANGLNAGGSDAVLLGLAPTPAVAFYSKGKHGGAMITASHNPPDYNGVKLFDGRGASVSQQFYHYLLSKAEAAPPMADWDAVGSCRSGSGLYEYIESVAAYSRLRKKWKIGLDPGNGATSITAAMALTMAGCSATTVNLAPDGYFKGRGSEPDEKALSSLSSLVREKNLDAGFAFDGDGDRVAIVDEKGAYIPQDIALAYTASNIIMKKGGGSVVVNVDTSAIVDLMVESAGGSVHRSKVGDVYILEDLMSSGGSFGGETCGAWIFPEKSLCPAGLLSSIAFLNLLDENGVKPSQISEGLPRLYLTRRKVSCPNALKPQVIDAIKDSICKKFPASNMTDNDGVRASFPDKSWILIRPSGTEPLIRITTEASTAAGSKGLADASIGLIEGAMEGVPRKR